MLVISMKMRRLTQISSQFFSCFCFFIIIITSTASSPLPSHLRGAHPLDVKYFGAEVIKCKDGSNSFTKDRINDDFCDCFDGTDEPGTSACPRGKFYCRNMGSQPRFLFSSRVNDQICDCCDGSDEFDGVTFCPNTCIMGGSIQYKAQYHPTGNSKAIKGKEGEGKGKVGDVFQNLKDLKVLAVIQLIIIVLWAFWLVWRRAKSRRRRHRL